MSHPDESRAYLDAAVALALENVGTGGGPFGALLVTPGGRTFTGSNRVAIDNDPTAHAEVVAIRRACAAMDTVDLTGCTLYSSCEPCPLCVAASLWARLDAVFYAADRHDAARAGFDDRRFFDHFNGVAPAIPTLPGVTSDKLAPFTAWDAKADRVNY